MKGSTLRVDSHLIVHRCQEKPVRFILSKVRIHHKDAIARELRHSIVNGIKLQDFFCRNGIEILF